MARATTGSTVVVLVVALNLLPRVPSPRGALPYGPAIRNLIAAAFVSLPLWVIGLCSSESLEWSLPVNWAPIGCAYTTSSRYRAGGESGWLEEGGRVLRDCGCRVVGSFLRSGWVRRPRWSV